MVARRDRGKRPFAVYNICRSIYVNDANGPSAHPATLFCSECTPVVLVGFRRVSPRGVGGTRGILRSMVPSQGIAIATCCVSVVSLCGSSHAFHSSIVVKKVIALVVTLVNLLKCADSRAGHHKHRVTVHGIGKTAT